MDADEVRALVAAKFPGVLDSPLAQAMRGASELACQEAERAPPASQPIPASTVLPDDRPVVAQAMQILDEAFSGLTDAEHLMLTPIASWPKSAFDLARGLMHAPASLKAITELPLGQRKAYVVEYVVKGMRSLHGN